MAEDLARGKQIFREEHCEVLEATAADDRVALQVKWIAVPVGTLRPGDSMLCESAIVLRFQGDGIIEQHCDCLEDFFSPRA